MKKVTIFQNSKGGIGKTTCVALAIAKIKDTSTEKIKAIDIDSRNRSLIKRFSDNPDYAPFIDEFSLLSKDNVIDNGLFNTLLLNLAQSKKTDHFLLDLGGNESKEILGFINSLGIEDVAEIFKENNLDVTFITPMLVGDRDCFDHLTQVVNSLKNHVKHIVYVNAISLKGINQDSFTDLKKYCAVNNIEVRIYGKEGLTPEVETRLSDFFRDGFKKSLGFFKPHFRSIVENFKI